MSPPLLAVDGLGIRYRVGREERQVVSDISFGLEAGEVLALVGESGSGKTSIAQAVLGLLPGNGRISAGRIVLEGTDIAHWPERRLAPLRGARIALVPQDPVTSLNPVRTVGAQIEEVLELHGERDRTRRRTRVLELLERVGLGPAAQRTGQYPHELSGGMLQRVLIAIAVALRPALIVADEPTSALDVTVQRRILDLLDELRREDGTAVLLVTHDLGVAADRADRLLVLRRGQEEESGPTARVLGAPRSAYARQLLRDAPSLAAPPPRRPADGPVLLRVEALAHDYPNGHRALDGVAFTIPRGATHALVGESGSGKTTLARCVAGLLRPGHGQVRLEDTAVEALRGEALRQFRRQVQLVYQNPFASLDPRQRVREIIEEPLRNFAPLPRAERARRVAGLAERVGLAPELLNRLPAALSGGQRQRVAIARALVLQPRLLVLDEAVSALDVSVQARILELLAELQRDLGLTYLFVTHDLAVVRQITDTVTVLRQGRVEEAGPVGQVFARPRSDYARDLIAAIPGRTAIPEGALS
ncbi:dipeptide ABC transporter ATP-binding protein [Paracraurococcus lichenis]|uniref:ABC transporter ATP-binding protein n=1 Tax=Paracraurococcus lichenis TaxID=3064888 RepID=A0ABT9E5M0_9PROT|nr:ABC transporter ATP-binding protein [Paracraurococcus sp. LOR1-02]MDO9711475.1 ABC transporter ATP-binding protein [Paracraurococcus sp. LOR1-02]